MTAQRDRPRPAEIVRELERTKQGDAILTPEACAAWLPGMDMDLPSEAMAWTAAFEELIVGTEIDSSPAMNKRTRETYFRQLKAFQLAFWRQHAGQIRARIDAELLPEYEEYEE